MHHLDSWVKRDQLDVTCFIISLFNAQHVLDVNTSILRSLRLICWVISWVVLLWFDVCWCYVVVWLGWCGICMQAEACNTTHEITQQISRKLLRMDVLTSETCWALNKEIINKWHHVGLSLLNNKIQVKKFPAFYGTQWFVKLWRITHQKSIGGQRKRRKWNWIGHTLRKETGATKKNCIGHTLRKETGAIEKTAFDWNLQG